VVRKPGVLAAVNPWYAIDFFIRDGLQGFLILGAVVLVLTGGEALYADMGHFGRRPIRLAWFGLVLPALMLNYFGQAALLLEAPASVENPFYALVPHSLLYPMVGLATVATIVASQALISGAFSLTQQAVQLGYSPRVTIVHTSERERGQIYVPEVNRALMVACVWLVVSFKSSTRTASPSRERWPSRPSSLPWSPKRSGSGTPCTYMVSAGCSCSSTWPSSAPISSSSPKGDGSRSWWRSPSSH
jgi:KUP system potassium uptake protein